MKRNIIIGTALTGALSAAFTGGMILGKEKTEKFSTATTMYAKNPGSGACICLINVSAAFCGTVKTSASGIQAQLTSKNTGRQWLLFEDASCTLKPIFFN